MNRLFFFSLAGFLALTSACGSAESPQDFLDRLTAIVAAADEAALWDAFIDKGQVQKLMQALPRMAGEATPERVDELWEAMSEDKGRMLRRFVNFEIPWWELKPDSTYLEFAPKDFVQRSDVEPAAYHLWYSQGDQETDFVLKIVRFSDGPWYLFEYPDR
ncbi:MAG: hypothetical protein AAF433_12940 [Bacteroidota bacterium]